MESGLQSNEIRIPKLSSQFTGINTHATQILSSNTKLLRVNNSEQSIPDFDLESPCHNFKSQLALSLAVGSQETKSLDFSINYGLKRSSPIHEEPATPVQYFQIDNNNLNSMNTIYTGRNDMNPTTTNIWSTMHKQSLPQRNLDSAEVEVLRLRKECQSLIEENRRLMSLASGMVGGNLAVPGNSPNIEAVILQTQVDTLQWQLKQVDASRQMYRAVMEEVIRFLEKCHRNLECMQNEQISRSKSVHHVYRNENSEENGTTGLRARSSTNIMNVPQNDSIQISDESFIGSPASSYNNFRDFTWRRSPKYQNAHLVTSECDPKKLSQDAFRLLRTAQNLLNTQEPNLTLPKNNIDQSLRGYSPPTAQTVSLGHLNNDNISQPSPPPVQLQANQSANSKQFPIDSNALYMSFARRLSRLSLRSSTDGSVHSNTSSKNETDEEHQTPPTSQISKEQQISTEDESGFSSISSFQEIGVPMNSTITNTTTVLDDQNETKNNDLMNIESKNSTLKGNSFSELTANIGLPIVNNHRRWSSNSSNTNLHLFSKCNNDESPSVLWV